MPGNPLVFARVPPPLRERVRARAAARETSMSAVVRDALTAALDPDDRDDDQGERVPA